MKYLLRKSTLLIALCTLPAYGDSFSAKRAGQGFTSITQSFTSSMSNPALLPKFDNDDDVYISTNIGVIINDEHSVYDNSKTLLDDIDKFQEDVANINNTQELEEQVDVIVDDFLAIDEKIVVAREGINAQIIIPNKLISLGVFVNQYGRFAGQVNYAQEDEDVLIGAIEQEELDLNDLNSSALIAGYAVSEMGLMLGYELINHVNYDINIGTKIKYQRLDVYYNNASIADLDDDDFDFDDDEYLTDSDGTDIDLGLYIAWGEQRQWHAALVSNNLLGQEVRLAEQNLTFSVENTTTLGLSYQIDWLTVATEFDLNDREHFQELNASQYAAFGAEFRMAEHMQFRLGYRNDMNNVDPAMYTMGIGMSPWDVVSIDLAGFTGEKDTGGLALEIGVKF